MATPAKEIPKKDVPHSRGHYGSPKKGGGGGKGTWGKGGLGDLYVPKMSPKDPAFDPDTDDNKKVVLEDAYVAPGADIEAIIREYFVSGEVEETCMTVEEKLQQNEQPNFVRKCMVYAMEHHAYEREIVSRLFVTICPKSISRELVCEGFQQTLDLLDDIVLDSPDAVDLLGKFIARAILDEVMPPSFLTNCVVETPKSKEAAALATALLNEPHRGERILHIWGPGDLSSVKRLKKEVTLLVEEYMTNLDEKELDLSIRKLNAPSFYFEVVKQAVRHWILKESEKKSDESKKAWQILKICDASNLIGKDHFEKGIGLLVSNVKDLQLDIPTADTLLIEAIESANNDNFISTDRAKVYLNYISKIQKSKK